MVNFFVDIRNYKLLNKSFVIFICTFDPFGKGRHRYTFENICKEDSSIVLGNGTLNDVDDEMLEFLEYVVRSTDEGAIYSKSDLIKAINQKVNHVKNDKTMEVQYMTLFERDKINFTEDRDIAGRCHNTLIY